MKILAMLRSELQHIIETWKLLSHNWLISSVNKFVILLFLLSLGVIIWRWQLLPPQVPLWYAKPWGADQLASPYWLFILPFSSLVIFAVNILLSVYLTAEYLVFTQTLSLTSFLVSFLSFITLVKILFLVS